MKLPKNFEAMAKLAEMEEAMRHLAESFDRTLRELQRAQAMMKRMLESGDYRLGTGVLYKQLETVELPEGITSNPQFMPVSEKAMNNWPETTVYHGRKEWVKGKCLSELVATTPRVSFHDFQPQGNDLPPWEC